MFRLISGCLIYLLLSRHIGGNGEERGVLRVPTDEAGTDPHLKQMVKPNLSLDPPPSQSRRFLLPAPFLQPLQHAPPHPPVLNNLIPCLIYGDKTDRHAEPVYERFFRQADFKSDFLRL